MQSMDNDLIRLVKSGVVDEIDVLSKAGNKVAVEAAIAEARCEREGASKLGKPTASTSPSR